jgi:hypothetical protein
VPVIVWLYSAVFQLYLDYRFFYGTQYAVRQSGGVGVVRK